ncbi:DUF300-domain-containing protein [Pleomassaria siparia CBS 279.74]|uniref:DUF300-domain-containing protein n=1 Tax=Pleomassaria siparia CBS 279.74 TaxID=1314801 RepID=A0A6G1KPC1_9PLEO|nr:DUF300-domain-containing protein [Pleomassaria siparia CBS 279.74]
MARSLTGAAVCSGEAIEDEKSELESRTICVESKQTDKDSVVEEPIWKGLTFHHFGLILSASFGALAVAIAFFLVFRHATHYLKPYEQKHIIRILIMIPIYAIVSFLSYLYYHNAIYFELVRDCYEAFAIASFFTLMCHYIAPNLHEQKEYFRNVQPKNWVWPLDWMQKCTGGENKGFLRRPRSGLTWFNVVWISIFQYCFIRPFFTVVAVLAQTQGKYCQSSKDPRFAYIWVAGFEAISVSFAMYCVIQFYIQLKDDLAPHRPFLKVLCIKLVIFFCFWQSWIISLLTAEGGPLKASSKIAGPDLRIGIPSALTCVEMAIFAVMHLYAFPWKPYDIKQGPIDVYSSSNPEKYAYGPWRAILNALNPWDIVKACGRGFRWLFVGVRHRQDDISYQTKLESISSDTSYQPGATFVGDGESPVKPAKVRKGSGRSGKTGSEDSDTAGLLSYSQANPSVSQDPYHGSYNGSSASLGPDSLPLAPTPGQEYGVTRPDQSRRANFEPQDTTYHGASHAAGPPQYLQLNLGRPSTEWDFFAGTSPRPEQAPGAPAPPRRPDMF